MKRLFVTTSLALSLSCGAAFAQGTSDPQTPAPQSSDASGYHHRQPNPHRQAERLTRKLNLTPDQTSKIEPILANRDQQMEALHGNTQLSPQDRHAQKKTIMQQTEQQMSDILTPDQMTQLKAMRHDEHHHEQSGENSPAPGA